MPTFREVIAGLEAVGEGFEIDAPEGWRQGRTAYGGMTAALAVAGAGRTHADLPLLRSAQFALVGPAAGRLRFESRILRQGRSATVVGVEASGEAGPAARAILTYGAARESAVAHDTASGPAVPPPEECELYFPPGGFAPGFAGNFDARLAAGARPLTPGAAPDATVWVRHVADAGDDPVLALIALDLEPGPVPSHPGRRLAAAAVRQRAGGRRLFAAGHESVGCWRAAAGGRAAGGGDLRLKAGRRQVVASQNGENRSSSDCPAGVFWTRLRSPRPP
jgi:hypothetical protein